MKFKRLLRYFSLLEWLLWGGSMGLIVLAFLLFDQTGYFAMIASLVGVSSLIFCAKGNPIGQILMLIFATIYGIISWNASYYGEVITYLGMTAPMAIFSLVSWLKNPYQGRKAEVQVNRLKGREYAFLMLLTAVVTAVFYCLLHAFGTENLLVSTLSVATSFFASYLTFRRSPYFALAYAANDVVLIVLWTVACLRGGSYFSVIICFIVFFANDLYGFFSWLNMQKRQVETMENDQI